MGNKIDSALIFINAIIIAYAVGFLALSQASGV